MDAVITATPFIGLGIVVLLVILVLIGSATRRDPHLEALKRAAYAENLRRERENGR